MLGGLQKPLLQIKVVQTTHHGLMSRNDGTIKVASWSWERRRKRKPLLWSLQKEGSLAGTLILIQ
jgi:hypothetical protein